MLPQICANPLWKMYTKALHQPKLVRGNCGIGIRKSIRCPDLSNLLHCRNRHAKEHNLPQKCVSNDCEHSPCEFLPPLHVFHDRSEVKEAKR